jgi:hypothetical protein
MLLGLHRWNVISYFYQPPFQQKQLLSISQSIALLRFKTQIYPVEECCLRNLPGVRLSRLLLLRLCGARIIALISRLFRPVFTKRKNPLPGQLANWRRNEAIGAAKAQVKGKKSTFNKGEKIIYIV